ncbi:L-rhamnose mutarotase [Leifsonia poae]|uniref:L-rhamnose mutarotase n=1 Tax=Leifsonia poae TaxID=110933 RepID=UPI001CBE844F|nr:L-rhamnose mutarotase [Leifsonia poae]
MGTGGQRVCFQVRVRPELLDEYRRAHEAVWPAMLREIEASGRRNYTLFLAEDGLLIGYYEADSPEASARYLAESAVAAEWEAAMGRFFLSVDGRADQDAPHLNEVFNLADQLATSSPTTAEHSAHIVGISAT